VLHRLITVDSVGSYKQITKHRERKKEKRERKEERREECPYIHRTGTKGGALVPEEKTNRTNERKGGPGRDKYQGIA